MLKPVCHIPFQQIDSIPRLIRDFLDGRLDGAADFSFNKENFRRQISARRATFPKERRGRLSEVLHAQMAGLQLSEKQRQNLSNIKNENCFTVVTGHQLNLFSGPAFFIYKILQTVKTAGWLQENFPDEQFAPIFWMATEDHDFEEVSFFRTASHFYETKAKSGGAVGRIKLEDTAFITAFEQEFKDSVFGTELIGMMKRAYQPGTTLAEATKNLVQMLFAGYGLLVIDGDDAVLKAEMTDIFERELTEKLVYSATRKQVSFLEANYGKVQVNPREINLFYLDEIRERIDPDGENFRLAESGTTFSRQEMLEILHRTPEKFSPNALLRPVFQETVLPNLAYIGGNAEIMYWLELPDYFKAVSLAFPVLIPRNSMLFLPEKTLGKIENIGLQIGDFFKDFPSVISKVLLENNEILSKLDTAEEKLREIFGEISAVAAQTDKTFGNLVEAEQTRQLKAFKRMRKRLLRAEKIKQSERVERLENLFLSVHPGRAWQERSWNFSVFFAAEGAAWLEACYGAMDPMKSELVVMEI